LKPSLTTNRANNALCDNNNWDFAPPQALDMAEVTKTSKY